MPRYKRICPPGSVQHIIDRFACNEFRLDYPRARAEYRDRFVRALGKTDWQALTLTLMSSHSHKGLVAGSLPPHKLMQPLKTGFARWINTMENRFGPVFGDRYRNITCDEERVAKLIAYLHNNPVRAGVVVSPELSDWTCHLEYIGERPAPPWLNVELGLSLCGFSSSPSGRLAFHDFVCEEASKEPDRSLSVPGLDADRARIRHQLGAPVELASPTISGSSDEPVHTVEFINEVPLRPRRDVAPQKVIEQVAAFEAIHPEDLLLRTRRQEIVRARIIALLVWAVEFGLPQIEMARALGIANSTASHHICRAETSLLGGLREKARHIAHLMMQSLAARKPAG
jgi:hypothetical protein